MSARFKCNRCQREFAVNDNMGSQSCPYCESVDLSEKSGGLSINTASLKKYMIPGIIVIGAILLIIILIKIIDHKPPVIKKVDPDRENCRIIVNASSSSGRLQYSFDNGKTYQNSKVYQVQNPGTFMIVVRDDKRKTALWAASFTFTKEDIAKCGAPRYTDPQITAVDFTDETIKGKNDGQIRIQTIYGKKPLKFSINGGQNPSNDSVFNNLNPGKYKVTVVDDNSRTAEWPDSVIVSKGIDPRKKDTIGGTESGYPPPPQSVVENKLNRLFFDPDNASLLDSVRRYFVNQTMNVDCELIGIPQNTPYQVFQFLQRRYEGKPGSKRIKVLELKGNGTGKISYLKIKEIPVSNK